MGFLMMDGSVGGTWIPHGYPFWPIEHKEHHNFYISIVTKNGSGPTVWEEYEKARKRFEETKREREERKRKLDEAAKRWKEAQKERTDAEKEAAEEEARWQQEMHRKDEEEAEREANFGEDRAQREWAEEQEKGERAKEWRRHERKQREEAKARAEWLKENARTQKNQRTQGETEGKTQAKAGFSFMNWTRSFHGSQKEKTGGCGPGCSCYQKNKEKKLELRTVIERIVRHVVFKFGSCVLLYVLGNISFKAFFSAILTGIYFFLLAVL